MKASWNLCRDRGRIHDLRGFTLPELLIVVVIVAVLATLSAPSFREMLAKQRLRSAVSALNESLWVARGEAVKRNADIAFTFASIGSGWEVKSGATTLHTQEAFPGVASAGRTYQFNSLGRLTSGSGTLDIEAADANVYQCVTVSLTGRATVEDKKCS